MIDTIGMTDIGNGRPSNQDAYLLRQKEKNGKLYLLAVVCDGMGGLKKGEIASHYIVEVLKQWFDETLFDGLETMGIDMIEQNLIDLIRRINQNLLLMSRRMEETKSMGSTLTLLFVEEHEFFVLNVGDSRTYWFDRDRKFVTTDHTLAELELRAGHLTKEQAKKDPRRHILIQCVGVTKDIRIDCYKGRLNPGMEFLLCTDGFYGLLEEEEIYQVEASKEQIAILLGKFMVMPDTISTLDETDAIAIAYCHHIQGNLPTTGGSKCKDWGDFIKQNPDKVL